MSSAITRAAQLREFRRHDEAIAMLLEQLARDPDDPLLHLELALNRIELPEQRRKALDDIDAAIGRAPDIARFHALKAHIQCRLGRDKDALETAAAAIRLDPADVHCRVAEAEALCGLTRWAEAEAAARQALELDPDDPSASNLLAHSLRMQNRLDESEGESQRRLERDPENAFSLANAGWSALQRHDPRKAEEMFREALRLEPGMEHARIGLREAFKARSPLYRLFLRWVFFLQKHNKNHQWLIIIGIYLGYRFGVVLLRAVHPLAAVPLIVAYLFLAFGSWLASGVGHFLLLKDPVARLSLNRRERLDGLLVGGLLVLGLVVLVLGATPLLPVPFLFLGAALMGAAIPGSLVFGEVSKAGRVVFASMTILVVLCAVLALGQAAPDDPERSFTERGGNLLLVSLLAVVGTTWAGMIPGLRRSDDD